MCNEKNLSARSHPPLHDKNTPENGDTIGVLVGAEQEGAAGVELEVPRGAALGVAVVHDSQVPGFAAQGRLFDGEHGDAVVPSVAHEDEAVSNIQKKGCF